MPILIATPGLDTSNSYATVIEADAFHELNYYAAAWVDIDGEVKKQLLITATRLLDEQYDWLGEAASATQALRWPRGGVLHRDGAFYLDNMTIPTFLREATAEYARMLFSKDRQQALDDAATGIESVTAGEVSVTFAKNDRIPVIPENVYLTVAPYVSGKASGSGVVPLVRA
jgi:hypothetical protein